MTSFNAVSHVIFDVDGLLLDTETLYTKMMQAICEPHGKQFTWEIKVKQMGRKEHESAQVLIDELNLPITVDQYIQTIHQLMKEYFPKAQLMTGVKKLVDHLHKHNIPMALATGGDSVNFKLKTKEHQDVFSVFSHAVFSTEDPDVKHGKPSPDCFIVAANRFNHQPQPKQVLVFEDAPNGVESAASAGMQVVWIPDHNVDRSLMSHRATQILDSLEQFKPEHFGLPAYDS